MSVQVRHSSSVCVMELEISQKRKSSLVEVVSSTTTNDLSKDLASQESSASEMSMAMKPSSSVVSMTRM